MSKFINSTIQIVQGKAGLSTVYNSIFMLFTISLYKNMSNIFMKHFHIQLECCLWEKLRPEIIERRSILKYKYLEDSASLDLIKRISDPQILPHHIKENIFIMKNVFVIINSKKV